MPINQCPYYDSNFSCNLGLKTQKMKTFILTFFTFNSLTCKTAYFTGNNNNIDFNSVAIDTLFQDKISIRAIVIDANKIWYAADKGRFGFIIWIIIKIWQY
jgi:hypothetical protein